MSNLTYQFIVSTGASVPIRIIPGQQDSLWFVLRDVLDAMESTTKTTDAIASINQGIGDGFVVDHPIPDSLGRSQQTTIVHESGVTYLVTRSNTEAGKRLNRYLHVEVLPSIRKTGKFSQEPSIREPKDPALAAIFRMLVAVDEVKQEVEMVKAQAATLAAKTDTLVERLDTVEVQSQNGVPLGFLSKKQAWVLHASFISKETFEKVVAALGVRTQRYAHEENGYRTNTTAYHEQDVVAAMLKFRPSIQQKTPQYCQSEYISGYFKCDASKVN